MPATRRSARNVERKVLVDKQCVLDPSKKRGVAWEKPATDS